MEKLTAQQRQMVVAYFAEETAREMPASDFYNYPEAVRKVRMDQYRLVWATGRAVPTDVWDSLIEQLVDYQSFDRDPEGFLYQHGQGENIKPSVIDDWRNYLNDLISAAINEVAGA